MEVVWACLLLWEKEWRRLELTMFVHHVKVCVLRMRTVCIICTVCTICNICTVCTVCTIYTIYTICTVCLRMCTVCVLYYNVLFQTKRGKISQN